MVRIFYVSIANHGELERSLGVSQTQPENQSYPYIYQIIRCAAGFAQSWKFIDNHGHHLTSCHWTHLPMFQKSTNHLPVRKRAQDRTLSGLWPLKTLGRGPFRTKKCNFSVSENYWIHMASYHYVLPLLILIVYPLFLMFCPIEIATVCWPILGRHLNHIQPNVSLLLMVNYLLLSCCREISFVSLAPRWTRKLFIDWLH